MRDEATRSVWQEKANFFFTIISNKLAWKIKSYQNKSESLIQRTREISICSCDGGRENMQISNRRRPKRRGRTKMTKVMVEEEESKLGLDIESAFGLRIIFRQWSREKEGREKRTRWMPVNMIRSIDRLIFQESGGSFKAICWLQTTPTRIDRLDKRTMDPFLSDSETSSTMAKRSLLSNVRRFCSPPSFIWEWSSD